MWPPSRQSLLGSLGSANVSKTGDKVWWQTWEAKAGGSGVQGQLWLCTKFEGSLSYIRSSQKKKKKKISRQSKRKQKPTETKLQFSFLWSFAPPFQFWWVNSKSPDQKTTTAITTTTKNPQAQEHLKHRLWVTIITYCTRWRCSWALALQIPDMGFCSGSLLPVHAGVTYPISPPTFLTVHSMINYQPNSELGSV